MLCSLCNCTTREFEIFQERDYRQCINCKAILLSPTSFLSPQEEKFRYRLHNNDINDPGYISFVSPVINKIKSDFSRNSTGLDYGCGTGPVIASELQKSGYRIELYDPFFKPDKKLLNEQQYDFIICCEVMEHFHSPLKEFRLLRSLLKPGGKLYCKTAIWNDAIDFPNWYYKNDQTHVFFYHRDTILWIRENLEYTEVKIHDDFMVFTR